MKKASIKPTKATATKAKAAPAKAAAVATKPVAKKAPAKAAKKTVVVAAKRPAAPAVKAVAKKATGTVITALVDVGFGNTLYLRGEGAGLTWDSGVAMESVADNKWELALPAANNPIVYKFLINDFNWSVGEDYQTESGATVTVMPAF